MMRRLDLESTGDPPSGLSAESADELATRLPRVYDRARVERKLRNSVRTSSLYVM
jgi:hypothetical protein